MFVHNIPGKLDVQWRDDVRAIVDTWTTYDISLTDFKAAVLEKGLVHARANNGQAWIVDSSKATGAFTPEIQEYIGKELFPAFAKNGVKYFITITSTVSNMTKTTVSTYAAKTGPNGLKLVELGSVDDAVTWLKANA